MPSMSTPFWKNKGFGDVDKTISTTCADGLFLCSQPPTRPHWWNLKERFLSLWLCWFPKKLSESALCNAEELAEKVLNNLEAENGRHWLLSMGVALEKVSAMTGDELIAISKEVSSWPRKEPEFCESCGQDL